jgi:hypothetical protein
MNAGARAARASLLLFLHADSGLTDTQQLRRAVDALRAIGPKAAGHFPLRFQRTQAGHELFYRYLEGKTALARPYTINGDQGLMLGAEFFRALGGYDESLPFLEDQRLAAKVFEQGRWVTFSDPLTTSARRFEREGEHRRYALMALIMGMHAADAREWFEAAPQVYAQQSRAAKLDLLAYLALTWHVLIAAGPARAARILWRAGSFTRQNFWQPFYWLDTALRLERRPFLRAYDWIPAFAGKTWVGAGMTAIGNALATLVIAAWYLLVLPVGCAVLG